MPLDLGGIVVLVQAHGWVSGALSFCGRPDDAVAHNEQAIRIAELDRDQTVGYLRRSLNRVLA